MRCFEGCSLGYGCAGPGKTFNESNGCRRCDTVVLDKYGKQVSVCEIFRHCFFPSFCRWSVKGIRSTVLQVTIVNN